MSARSADGYDGVRSCAAASAHRSWPGRIALAPVCLLLLVPVNAHAVLGDRLELFAAETVTHDDNVFRISDRSDASALLGEPATGDTRYTTSLGLNLDVPVSRQRLVGGVSWDVHRYRRFDVLDFTDRHARAALQWQAGSRLDGELGLRDDRALASLANVQSGVRSGTPNPLDTRQQYLKGEYRITPSWRGTLKLDRVEQTNGAQELTFNDAERNGVELGGRYVSRAGNSVGLGLQYVDARLPNRQTVAATTVDNSYRQHGAKLTVDWQVTAKSRFAAGVGQVWRRFDELDQRDYSGIEYSARYDWQPTAKLGVLLRADRGISDTEEVNVGFVLERKLSVRPVLRLTDKTTLSALYEDSFRDYRGDPIVLLGLSPARSDRVRSAGVEASWRPAHALSVQLSARRETRSSNIDFGDYRTDIFSIGARLAF